MTASMASETPIASPINSFVRYAENLDAVGSEKDATPVFIVENVATVMVLAVYLDRELQLRAEEIENVAPTRMLPAKLVA